MENHDSDGSFRDEENAGWYESFSDAASGTEERGWTDLTDCFTTVSYDQATHDAWMVAKEEITIVRKNILQQLRIQSLDGFNMNKLIDYFIDRLWIVIDRSLNDGLIYSFDSPLTKKLFKKIVGTFFLASSFSLSAQAFFENEWIVRKNLCSHEEYRRFWQAVTKKDSQLYDDSIIYLWQKIGKEMNATCRDLFLQNWESYVEKHVTIDDDKDHYNGSSMGYSETSGLKPSQFVRDNRVSNTAWC